MSTFHTLVVNTVGEPGCGKTTLSFWLCQALKQAGIVVEFVPEVIKYECFTPEGRNRVRSGLFDFRYLAQQARLFRAVSGQVEVMINDGAFELFCFYGQQRMTAERTALLRAHVNTLIAEGPNDVIFVAPVRSHGYETHGRIESENEAKALRDEMLNFLNTSFGTPVWTIRDDAERDRLLQAIVGRVHENRRALAEAAHF